MARRTYKFRTYVCPCGAKKEQLVEVGVAATVSCQCGQTMEPCLSETAGLRACEAYQRVYDPRDDNLMIHNLDQQAKRCGLPGYERRPRR
jgi:hypothetical protein